MTYLRDKTLPAGRNPGLITDLGALLRLGADLAANWHSGWCLLAAPIVQQTLTRLGYDGVKMLGIDIEASFFKNGVPASAPHGGDPAWQQVQTCTYSETHEGWAGHAVGYVPSRYAGTHSVIVDLTAAQFTNPQSAATLPPLALPAGRQFLGGEPEAWRLDDHHHVVLAHNPQLTREARAEAVRAQDLVHEIADALADAILDERPHRFV